MLLLYSCFTIYLLQVHGFDLRCLAFVGALSHAYVSGADDEKVFLIAIKALLRFY